MKPIKSHIKTNWALLAAGAFLPLLASQPVHAASPTIQVQEQGFNSVLNEVTIKVNSNGMITLPGGNKQNLAATLVVKKNGVYSFQAEVNGAIVTDSIHVTQINSEKLRTNNPNVKLKVSYKDELSGISHVRMKNETTGGWSAWRMTATTTKSGTETIPWAISTAQEGDRSVHVQFKDQAGNLTPGAAYDNIIYDVTGPTFTIAAQKYYVREDTFNLDIANLVDTYSPVAKVSIKVGSQPFQDFAVTSAFVKDLEDGLDVVVPAIERSASGVKTIQVKATDDLGNVSQTKVLNIFHDNKAPSKGDIELRTSADEPVKPLEGGRQWSDSAQDYVYFKPEDNIRLVDDKNITVKLNLADEHAGVFRDVAKNGQARVDVIEYNIETTSTRAVIPSSRVEVKRQTYHAEIKADGSVSVPWALTYGLEKQLAIVVYDNAGNSKAFYDEPIYMSSLNLVHFKVKDVVNPAVDWTPVTYSEDGAPPASMLAGGNVEYDIAYSLLSAEPPKKISGKLTIKAEHEVDGAIEYTSSEEIILEQKDIQYDTANPYFNSTFTIPEDAPTGSKVYATGWIQADFENNPSLRVYFPSKELSADKEIGIVSGNIHEIIQFRSVQ